MSLKIVSKLFKAFNTKSHSGKQKCAQPNTSAPVKASVQAKVAASELLADQILREEAEQQKSPKLRSEVKRSISLPAPKQSIVDRKDLKKIRTQPVTRRATRNRPAAPPSASQVSQAFPVKPEPSDEQWEKLEAATKVIEDQMRDQPGARPLPAIQVHESLAPVKQVADGEPATTHPHVRKLLDQLSAKPVKRLSADRTDASNAIDDASFQKFLTEVEIKQQNANSDWLGDELTAAFQTVHQPPAPADAGVDPESMQRKLAIRNSTPIHAAPPLKCLEYLAPLTPQTSANASLPAWADVAAEHRIALLRTIEQAIAGESGPQAEDLALEVQSRLDKLGWSYDVDDRFMEILFQLDPANPNEESSAVAKAWVCAMEGEVWREDNGGARNFALEDNPYFFAIQNQVNAYLDANHALDEQDAQAQRMRSELDDLYAQRDKLGQGIGQDDERKPAQSDGPHSRSSKRDSHSIRKQQLGPSDVVAENRRLFAELEALEAQFTGLQVDIAMEEMGSSKAVPEEVDDAEFDYQSTDLSRIALPLLPSLRPAPLSWDSLSEDEKAAISQTLMADNAIENRPDALLTLVLEANLAIANQFLGKDVGSDALPRSLLAIELDAPNPASDAAALAWYAARADEECKRGQQAVDWAAPSDDLFPDLRATIDAKVYEYLHLNGATVVDLQ